MTFLFRLWMYRDLKQGMYQVVLLCSTRLLYLCLFFSVFCKERVEIVTLWFKSSLCFSTFCDFWQLFFSLCLLFFSLSARLCQTMSYMQGYTLSGQGLRAYKVNGPWLKQVWSCSRMGNPELPEWDQGRRSCDVNLCPQNVWAEPADYKQRWKIRWLLICFNIRSHDPGNDLTSGGVWKVGMHAELPHQRLHPPLCHFCPILFMLHQPLYHELKKPATNIALRWPERRAGHLQKHACGLFVMCCWLLVLLLPTGCLPPPTQFGIESPSKSLVMTGCPPAPSGARGVILIPFHTSMWNWGHMARASVFDSGGDSSLWIAVVLWEGDRRDEA